MHLAFAAIVLTCLMSNSAVAQDCGKSDLDPSHYIGVDSHLELRQRIVADFSKYRTSDGALSMLCFAQHYSALGDNRPFRTNSGIRYGTEDPHERLYYFDVLVWRKQPGTNVETSVGYWAKFAAVDDTLMVVGDDGHVMETAFEETTLDPRTCSPSLFEPSHFENVRGKREIGRLIEHAILANIETYGEVDWRCFAEAFMEMNEQLPERLWANLLPEGPNQLGVYRFTILNVKLVDRLFPAPGGSNGEFTAVVRAENPKRIAIVERGGTYRWLEFE